MTDDMCVKGLGARQIDWMKDITRPCVRFLGKNNTAFSRLRGVEKHYAIYAINANRKRAVAFIWIRQLFLCFFVVNDRT